MMNTEKTRQMAKIENPGVDLYLVSLVLKLYKRVDLYLLKTIFPKLSRE